VGVPERLAGEEENGTRSIFDLNCWVPCKRSFLTIRFPRCQVVIQGRVRKLFSLCLFSHVSSKGATIDSTSSEAAARCPRGFPRR